MISFILAQKRKFLAARRLQKLVEAKRQSFETQRFIRNRQAQIKRRVKNEAAMATHRAASPTLTEVL